ncbi:hypothetical protein [Paenibacillus senegalensis]|nr:hypothetical protein [Paenibacillus senegalensis]
MQKESSGLTGLFWGVLISIPLWMSIIGWMQILHDLFLVFK